MKKAILVFITIFLVLNLFTYLASWFVGLEPNPAKWDQINRAAFVGIDIVFGFLSGVATYALYDCGVLKNKGES